MTGPLTALAEAYDKRRAWTLSLARLGRRGCVRHAFPVEECPPAEIGELGSRTKGPNFVCLEIADDDGALRLLPLKGPCSWPAGARFARELVHAGAHPLDIIVASADVSALAGNPAGDPTWTFRTSVDQLFWTHEDQRIMEIEEEEDGR